MNAGINKNVIIPHISPVKDKKIQEMIQSNRRRRKACPIINKEKKLRQKQYDWGAAIKSDVEFIIYAA